jgi:hypothetical protein
MTVSYQKKVVFMMMSVHLKMIWSPYGLKAKPTETFECVTRGLLTWGVTVVNSHDNSFSSLLSVLCKL